jgi:hypothetical protein
MTNLLFDDDHTTRVYFQFGTIGDADIFEPFYIDILEQFDGYAIMLHDAGGGRVDMTLNKPSECRENWGTYAGHGQDYFALFESSENARRFVCEVKRVAAIQDIDIIIANITGDSSTTPPDQPSAPLSSM